MSHTPMSIDTSLEDRTTTNSIQLDASERLPKEKLDAEAVLSHFEDDIPDGGLQAWCATFGGAMISFCTFGYASSFGVYQDYYVLAGTSTSSNISWIGSLQLFMLFFVGLPAGRLFDAGYFHLLLFCGSIIFVFCIFMLSLADPSQYYQLLLAQGIGMGVGGGFMLVPALSLQGHYWKKRRSMALGLVVCGSGCGGIVYPIMVNHLISGSSSVGFAWGVRATGFLTLGLLAIAQLLMRTRMPDRKDRGEQPKPNVVKVLTAPSFVFTVFGVFLVYLGLFMPYFYLQLWLDLHGIDNTLAFYTVAILNAASIPGRVIPNMLADYYGALNVVIPISLIMGALVFVMFGVTNTAAIIIFSILYGFFSGAYIALVPSVLAVLSNRTEELGICMGLGYCFIAFAMLTGTPIDGALLGHGSDLHWPSPIVFSAVVMIAGSGFTCIGRHFLVKVKQTQWT
ncbi:hypothetical protein FOMPIDRAFT_1021830 [Fomitopsis schrenkii]|uniref:Major facilitator superfamily (MFS) profile domain-containing protein n=1 Tax=Fomitopsis schrenkii TaxID=2126942 RepID=S8EMS0_FOMSC|nr:hypothetical protein FOMPIDRAFT_1021830 [Fomitopsis schrenkii]